MVQDDIVKRGNRNGQQAAKKITDGGLLGKAAKHIVRAQVNAVHKTQHAKDRPGVLRGGDAQSPVQQQHAHHDLEQQHGKAGEHERIAQSAHVYLILPVKQRITRSPLGGHDHLHDIAHTGDAEPDKRAEPGQKPPVLRIHEREKRRAEPQQNFQTIADGASKIGGTELFALVHAAARRKLVAGGQAQPAQVDHIAPRTDTKIHAGGFPDAVFFHAQMAAAGQPAYGAKGALPRRRIAGCSVPHALVNRSADGDSRLPLILCIEFAPPGRKRFPQRKAHAVGIAAYRACAQARPQRLVAVVFPQLGHVVQYLAELRSALFILCAHAARHLPYHLLHARPQPFVQGLLQFAYGLEVGVLAFHPAAHVEYFQMADAAPAVPQQLGDIFHAQPLGGEHKPVARIQFRQLPGEVAHRKLHQARQLAVCAGVVQIRHFRMFLRRQPVFGNIIGVQAFQKSQLGRRIFASALRKQGGSLPQRWQHMHMQGFGQMQAGRLPPAHMTQKLFVRQFGNRNFPLRFKKRPLVAVPESQAFQDTFAPPAQHVTPTTHHFRNPGAVQKLQKILIGAKTARNPEQAYEAPVKGRMKFQPYAHGDAGNFRSPQNFTRRIGLHPILVGYCQRPHALDPGVHDQVRGGFTALGVGVVHVVVKGKLIPVFRHFRQVVARKHAPHHSGRALHRAAEVVRQLELFQLVAVGAHHAFHDLHQGSCRISPQCRMRAVEHLVVQGLERQQAVTGLGAPGLKIAQQVDDRIGHAGNRRGHQFLDAMRVQAGVKQKGVGRGAVRFKKTVDQGKDVPVLLVKINAAQLHAHAATPLPPPCPCWGSSCRNLFPGEYKKFRRGNRPELPVYVPKRLFRQRMQ